MDRISISPNLQYSKALHISIDLNLLAVKSNSSEMLKRAHSVLTVFERAKVLNVDANSRCT